ncbi:hypothetical protein MMC16_004865 [Acarospora aff. strigata]|nr:hypothetical protein [Acarospora aff. strigata]
MPGFEAFSSAALENTHDHSLLKAHKILPRRRDHLPAIQQPSTSPSQPRNVPFSHVNSTGGPRKVATVISTAPTSTVRSPSLPLTPPSMSHANFTGDTSAGRSSPRIQRRTPQLSEDPGVTTPINQRSPPTPDVTPPSAQSEGLLPLRPRQPNPSSRAESFQTAREQQWSSDEEGQKSPSQSATTVRQKWLAATRAARLGEIGLGLGLELEDEGQATPTGKGSRVKGPAAGEFVTFDGAWGSEYEEEHNPSDHDSNAKMEESIAVRKRGTRQRYIPSKNQTTNGPAPSVRDDKASLMRSLSLRDRIQINRQSPASISTERFAQEIGWPLTPDDVGHPDKSLEVNNRRFSTMSATSTIVEAMVVDTPPQRQRTLRHTGKHPSLRSLSSPIQQSSRSSLNSNEQSHRLVHRNVKIPERGDRNSFASEASAGATSSTAKGRQNRNSFASELSTSAASSVGRHRRESVPVVVIPERRSSLPSSAGSSRRVSRSLSVTSVQKQVRPTTAADEPASYFDIPRQKSRTHSESLPSSATSRSEGRKRREFSPIIPRRSSSLSAPTSRNASRATSLTSASLKLRDAVLDQGPSVPQPTLQLPRPSQRLVLHQERTVGGDWTSLRPQSALITPFSQHSIQSSTPGTLEVSEATAISIYPHNNRSILVVQQRARRNSRPPELSGIVAEHIDDTSSPLTDQRSHNQFLGHSRPQVDSPLKNPREPPKPPEFKVIPPTPAVLTPASEANRQLGMRPSTSDGNQNAVGPLSLVRRALSNRRYSESFVSPFTRSPSKRATQVNRRPSVGEETDSKLHPFWRPRGFWDDLSDSDSDFGNDGFLISNSLGMPQRRASSGPVSLARRLTGLSAAKKSKSHGVRRKQSYGSLRHQSLQRGRTTHTAPGLGLHVQFTAWKSLQDRLDKRRAQREEARREKERAKLRKSIGAMIVQPDARVA